MVFFFFNPPKKRILNLFSLLLKKEENEKEKSAWDLIAQTWEQNHCHTMADDSSSPSSLLQTLAPACGFREKQKAIVTWKPFI